MKAVVPLWCSAAGHFWWFSWILSLFMDKKFKCFDWTRIRIRGRPGRKPGDRSTAALGGIDFWIAAEPDYLKAMKSWILHQEKAIGQLTKKCLSFAGPRVSEALLQENLSDRKYLWGLRLSSWGLWLKSLTFDSISVCFQTLVPDQLILPTLIFSAHCLRLLQNSK